MAMTDGAALKFTYPLSELLAAAAAAIFLYNYKIKIKWIRGEATNATIPFFPHSWAGSINKS